MVKARKYMVTKEFLGVPKRDVYEIVEYELPAIKIGEILVKNEFLSVDPYLSALFKYPVPFEQYGYNVGVIEESKDPKFPVGTRVVSHTGWCDYYIGNPSLATSPNETIYKVPNLKGLSPSLAVGAVGMPGATAYFGFLDECKPKVGETVVVTGAAGAVGSVAGQIAKIKGCKVIGFAGSDEKVKWLEEELGYDKAINYKTANIFEALKEAAPEGIDCYFDNVGGELSTKIISQMNLNGRVFVCGTISVYNDYAYDRLPKVTIMQPFIGLKHLTIKGCVTWAWFDRWSKAFEDLIDWIKSGKMKAPQHVTVGFDKCHEALVGMLAGENFGKAIVQM